MTAYDLPTEKVVLGTILRSHEMMTLARDLKPELFAPPHDAVLLAAQSVFAENRPVSIESVAEELENRKQLEKCGGTLGLKGLTGETTTDSPYVFGEFVAVLNRKREARANGPAETDAAVDAYYDSSKKEFVMRNGRGVWLSHPSRQFEVILKAAKKASSRDEAEALMAGIINSRDVLYTGSLAGHRAGFYSANGVRMLVTEGPRIIKPHQGQWPTIRTLTTGLLGSDHEHGERQLLTFYLWLGSASNSMAKSQWRPGHILALAGPIGCGKSLLQRLITEATGGRSADCFRYISGATQFNRDLFAAEHLVIDDAQASTDFRTRLQIAARLKEIAVGRDHSCHGKGRDAVNLRPLWRCSISLNDEGECLLVLPPLRPDIRDKIHLLKYASPPAPFPTETPDRQQAYWQQLLAELPAFLEFCQRLSTPAVMHDSRFGFAAFHHPTLVAELESQAPEVTLLELADAWLWQSPTADAEWTGTARELETALLDSACPVREQAKRLLTWGHAAGTYLGRLAKNHPHRVQQDRDMSRRGWILCKPRNL